MPKLTSKGQKTRQNILETAAELFWTRNYHGVTVDDICENAEVNKASFYRYFSSKEEAALEGLTLLFERTIAYIFEDSLVHQSDPIDRLEEIFLKFYQTSDNQCHEVGKIAGCPFINLGTELATENEKIREKITEFWSKIRIYFQQIYEEALELNLVSTKRDSAVVAKQIHTLLNGAMTQSKIQNNSKEFLEAFDVAKHILVA